MSSALCPGVRISRREGVSSYPSASRFVHWWPRYSTRWSCTRARPKRPTFMVLSGWWWLSTTSVMSSGPSPSAASGPRMSSWLATMPGSKTTCRPASVT